MVWFPEVRRVAADGDGGDRYVAGHRLVDDFLRFAGGRARPNTVRAYAHDLKTFFSVVAKEPVEVRAQDVFGFITVQQRARAGAENVARISDGGSGLAAATIRRRLAAVSAFYGYLVARGDVGVVTNPVPRGLPTRRRRRDGRGVPLVRGVRRLPRILEPDEVAALLGAMRMQRDRAMVQAMVLGGLRRCEVLGLRLGDLRLGEWRVFIAEGKGGHQRLVPLSPSFFATVAGYMNSERPAGVATDRVFVVLKGPNRGRPLSADGLDEIISAARARAGLTYGTCHELRHTCLTRLREHGMSLEALQAQAGHRSIASTQLYLHLGVDWLADEYRRAAEAIEAQALVGGAAMSATTTARVEAADTDRRRPPIGDWEQITARAPRLAATVDAYLGELAETRSPATVHAVSATLRQFAGYVSVVDPSCTTAAGITGHHVGDYCLWLALHPERRTRRTVTAGGIDRRIGELRRFFEHLSERRDADAPVLVPVPARRRRSRAPARDVIDGSGAPAFRPAAVASWGEIAQRAPQVAATMTAYLDQIAVSSRPSTVDCAGLALRQFADHLTVTDPACVSVAAVERRHIESFKLALADRPGRRGPASTQTIRHRLGMLRTFFERIIDWDDPDAPRRVPVLAGDIPKADEPLPKFLDDPTAAKFMAALAVEPNKRRRLIVELLARTGMRVGELGGLRDDAMYRLGDTWWLRIPLGKLHNDRTVPLHPMLVGLINDYRTWRGPTDSGLLVERDDHQPMDARTIYRHVAAVARRAGVAHVHPHALRHTLATQCINRGMSLEAIAALLGHRSPRMTLVYARISDTTVAEQYFTATDALEAGSETTAARFDNDAVAHAAQLHRRLLGNGHCTRPVELDCRFHTICEGCGFFQTGPEFIPILRRQRDDATTHGDHARSQLYNQLIDVIDNTRPDTATGKDAGP